MENSRHHTSNKRKHDDIFTETHTKRTRHEPPLPPNNSTRKRTANNLVDQNESQTQQSKRQRQGFEPDFSKLTVIDIPLHIRAQAFLQDNTDDKQQDENNSKVLVLYKKPSINNNDIMDVD